MTISVRETARPPVEPSYFQYSWFGLLLVVMPIVALPFVGALMAACQAAWNYINM